MEKMINAIDSTEVEMESKLFLSDLIKLNNKKNKIKAEVKIINLFTILLVIDI
jgi:hypothetical protein